MPILAKLLFLLKNTSWHGLCSIVSEYLHCPGHLGAGFFYRKDSNMYHRNSNRKLGLALAGSLVVLFSLMFATSLVVANGPVGI